MSREQLENEEAADALLQTAKPIRRRGYHSEKQLAKRDSLCVPIDTLLHECSVAPQSLREELLFLSSVSGLAGPPLRHLRAWIDGYSQCDIAAATGLTQQRVSQQLRIALFRCYDMHPVSFREFSRRTIYRKPHRQPSVGMYRTCRVCSEPYLLTLGEQGCCSSRCAHSKA
jgi:hypothetical protein